eukprot:PhM_4_TR15741/c0_g1_i1/m.91919
MVRVHAAAVGDNEAVVRARHGNDSAHLRDAADPRDVRLQDVSTVVLQQLKEAVPGVLVLARRQQRAALERLAHLGVAVVIVGVQELLHPLQVVRLERTRQLDAVRHAQGHVAVQREGEVGPELLAPAGEELDVLAEALVTIAGAVRTRDFGAHEPHLFGNVGPRRRAVEGQLGPHGATQQLVHGQLADLAPEVPQGKVDGADGLDRETLAAVVRRRAPHLVPHQLDGVGLLALDELAQMFLDKIARGIAADAHTDARRAVGGLDLDDDGAEGVDAPRLAVLLVLGVPGHRVGDGRRVAVDPMSVHHIVAVGALVARSGLLGVRTYFLDTGN